MPWQADPPDLTKPHQPEPHGCTVLPEIILKDPTAIPMVY
jgi:hypothetical protein